MTTTYRARQKPARYAPIGNYQLVQLLGQGGFAEVYLGKHIYLDTYAAIKLLKRQSAFRTLNGFIEEARIIAGLEHPHIVHVLEFGVDKQRPFLVMSYAPHGTLRQHYAKRVTPPALIVSHVKQVAAALHYAHERNIVHRDVKPENMLLDAENNVLLSDFGLAMRTRDSYEGKSVADEAGTMLYMAPEQLNGKPCAASDQYALGVVMYEWLCGCLPFDGPGMSIIAQHLYTPPQPLRKHVPTLPEAVEAVVLRALEKDPLQRFANVQELALAFEEACREEIFAEQVEKQPELLVPTALYISSTQREAITVTDTIAPTVSTTRKPSLSRRTVIGGLAGIGIVLGGVAIGRALIPGKMTTLSPGTQVKSTVGTPPPTRSGGTGSNSNTSTTQKSSKPSTTGNHGNGQNSTTTTTSTPTKHGQATGTPPASNTPSNPGTTPSATPSPSAGTPPSQSPPLQPPVQIVALTVLVIAGAIVLNGDTLPVSIITNIGNIPFRLIVDYSGLKNPKKQPMTEVIPGMTDTIGNATILWGPSLLAGQIVAGTYAQLRAIATDQQGNPISSQPILVQIML